MKCMQCSIEVGCILSACSTIRKIMEKLYEVNVRFRYIIHKFSAASKKTCRHRYRDQPLNTM